jgi:hypothetical protein
LAVGGTVEVELGSGASVAGTFGCGEENVGLTGWEDGWITPVEDGVVEGDIAAGDDLALKNPERRLRTMSINPNNKARIIMSSHQRFLRLFDSTSLTPVTIQPTYRDWTHLMSFRGVFSSSHLEPQPDKISTGA